jgi:DNA-directed RNA polymerase subunit RPC12/RpoP
VTLHCARCERELDLRYALYEDRAHHLTYCWRCADRILEEKAGLVRVAPFRGVRS